MVSRFRSVVDALEVIAPLRLAGSWDNVGILLESPPIPAPSSHAASSSHQVMLTIDFTEAVLQECIRVNTETLISYHPPIFSSWKRLTLDNHKQSLILRALRHGISIYSPHSALDSAENGVNDWLSRSALPPDFLEISTISPIIPEKENPLTGEGRVVRISQSSIPLTISAIVSRLKESLKVSTIRVALRPGASLEAPISAFSVCAGSGSSVVEKASGVDVYLTGEMSHHQVLAALADGVSVILTEHTVTERGYLEEVLKPKLIKQLGKDFNVVVSEADLSPITYLTP